MLNLIAPEVKIDEFANSTDLDETKIQSYFKMQYFLQNILGRAPISDTVEYSNIIFHYNLNPFALRRANTP